jgi:hypothetical protein
MGGRRFGGFARGRHGIRTILVIEIIEPSFHGWDDLFVRSPLVISILGERKRFTCRKFGGVLSKEICCPSEHLESMIRICSRPFSRLEYVVCISYSRIDCFRGRAVNVLKDLFCRRVLNGD